MYSILPIIVAATVVVASRANWRRYAVLLLLAAAVAATWTSDPLGALVGTTTLLVGGVVVLFSMRQFDGEWRGQVLPALMLLCIAAATSTATSHSIVGLIVSWVATSGATVAVLFYATRARSRRAAWRGLVTLGCSDLILVGTTTVLIVRNDSSLHHLSSGERTAFYSAVVVAAMARAGLTWRRSWVTDTVLAPTAVSALLHAGVVNAGAILIIRSAQHVPVVTAATAAAALIAGATIIALAPRIHERHDLKGQLATSTVSQMAFMLVMVGFGWPLLAVTHMVGHAAYKALRFINAAGATESRARRRIYPPTGARWGAGPRVVGAVLLGALTAFALVIASERDARTAFGIFGVAGIASWWARSSKPQSAPFATWSLCAAMSLAYPLGVEFVARWIHPLPVTGIEVIWWAPLVLLTVALLAESSRRTATRTTTNKKENNYATR